MSIKHMAQALTVSLTTCILMGAQVTGQQGASADPESLRQMLARQPDYTAVRREFFLSEGLGSVMALLGKEAKMGDKLAEVSEDVILIREPGKPTIKVFPKRKEYAEVPPEKKEDVGPPEELTNPEKVARDGNFVFRSAGVEEVGGHTCLKIEVSHKNEKYKAVKLTFWVAPGLKNLVIQSEVAVTRPAEGQVRYLTAFEDISLDVNEELFRVPPDYKKVAEPERLKSPEDQPREPRRPPKRRRTSRSTGRAIGGLLILKVVGAPVSSGVRSPDSCGRWTAALSPMPQLRGGLTSHSTGRGFSSDVIDNLDGFAVVSRAG